MHDITIEIEPNEKYRHVVESYHSTEPIGDSVPETEAEYREQHPAPDAAEAYHEKLDNAHVPDDVEDMDLDPVSWDDIGVSSDPDLVAKMATYFDGMDSDEPTDRLRAKLRLLDCEVYVNAQIAARAELREL